MIKYPKPQTTKTVDMRHMAGKRVVVKVNSGERVEVLLPDEPIDSLSASGSGTIVIDGGNVVQEVRHNAACQFDNFVELWVNDLHIDPSQTPEQEGDAIRVNSNVSGSVATFQNIRVDRVYGSYQGDHGDMLQTWGGPASLRVYNFTGYGNYQGFYLAPVHFDWHPPMGSWEFENVDLHGFGNGWRLWVLSGQGDGDFFTSDNGSGQLECINCFYTQNDDWEKLPSSGGDAFYNAGVTYVESIEEFVPTRGSEPIPTPEPEPEPTPEPEPEPEPGWDSPPAWTAAYNGLSEAILALDDLRADDPDDIDLRQARKQAGWALRNLEESTAP